MPEQDNDRVRIGGASADIVRLKAGIIVEDVFRGDALRQQAQDEFHQDSHVPDDGLASEHVRADRELRAAAVLPARAMRGIPCSICSSG